MLVLRYPEALIANDPATALRRSARSEIAGLARQQKRSRDSRQIPARPSDQHQAGENAGSAIAGTRRVISLISARALRGPAAVDHVVHPRPSPLRRPAMARVATSSATMDIAFGAATIPMWLMPSSTLTSTATFAPRTASHICPRTSVRRRRPRDDRDRLRSRAARSRRKSPLHREVAHQPVGIGPTPASSRVRRHRERQHRQRLAAGDADAAQRQQADDARDIGLRPAAGTRPGGREHRSRDKARAAPTALEQVLDRRARHAQRKAAAGGMADQRQRR